MILDSLGNLSTIKEMEDTASGKNVRDMTKAQALKATFRTLTVKCGSAGIPLLITNHTYDVVGSYVPMKEMSGGSGLKYNAGTIVFLSKKKVKDGTDVVGNIIKCKLQKSRVTKENSMAETLLNYESGLSPYYGLTEIAVKHGVFKKVSTRIELPDGRKVFEKNINDKPEDFFTDEIMQQLEVAVAKEFKYGSAVEDEVRLESKMMKYTNLSKVKTLVKQHFKLTRANTPMLFLLMVALELMKELMNVDYILTTLCLTKKRLSRIMMTSKRSSVIFLLMLLENHLEEYEYGDNRNHHTSQSDSE